MVLSDRVRCVLGLIFACLACACSAGEVSSGGDADADSDSDSDSDSDADTDTGSGSGGGPCQQDEDCDDGDACTGEESCVDGTCAAGEEVKCDDEIACTADSCNPADGSCSSLANHGLCPAGDICDSVDGCIPAPPCEVDGDCDDGVFCNGIETCDVVFGCLAGDAPACADGVDCTLDRCDVPSDGCANDAEDAACDDGQICNGAETCDAVTGCVLGDIADCDDGVDCTRDTCEDDSGDCVNIPDDARCDDGDECNGDEACDAAAGCQAGVDLDCDDGIGCTIDDCDGLVGCEYIPVDAICSDGAYCNGPEDCVAGFGCSATIAPDCDDADACTSDTCDEAADSCSNPIVDADGDGRGSDACGGTDCDDADPTVYPGAAELCDGISNDCDALVDEGCVANDTCDDAADMGAGGTFNGTTVGAGDDYATCGGGPDVVYSFTLAASEIVYFDTFGSAFDTQISVRSGCPGAEVAGGCGDDCGASLQSQLAMELAAGTYYVIVDGFGGESGDYTLRFRKAACAGATRIAASGSFAGNSCGQGNDTTGGCAGAGPDRNYWFTECPGNHDFSANTCGDGWDTVLYLRENGCANALGDVACNDDSVCGVFFTLQSNIAAVIDEGFYFLVIDGFGAGSCGAYTVDVVL